MTAIAAVIALSSTPALAQDAGTAEPVVETVPATDPAPSDPLSPASEPEAATTAAPAEEPVTEAKPDTAAAAPVPARRRAAVRAPAANRTPAPAARAAPVAASAPNATAVPSEAPVAPITAAPAAEVAMAAPPAAEPAPAPAAEALVDEDALPIAGAGLALLALAGAGVALRRRKRRHDDEELVADDHWVEAPAEPEAMLVAQPDERLVPTVSPEPRFVRPAEPVAVSPVTRLPNGFDISRFGRHVQAAYRGPTPDNPSLSLKHRLRRGAAMDQMERRAGASPAEPPAASPTWSQRSSADFMFRRDERAKEPELAPAYQS